MCFLPLALNLWPVFRAHPAQVVLQWDANTEPNLAGYKIYYGTSSRNYEFYAHVGYATTYTVSNLQEGITYYFAATAIDTSSVESDYSTEVVYSSSPCTYSLSPSTQSFPSSGGTGAVTIATNTGCSWTAASNASWVIITSNSSGRGSNTVNYSVTANSSSASRSGAITSAGQTLTVSQSGVSNSYSINASAGANGSISPKGTVTVNYGGTQTFTINPAAGYKVKDVKVDSVSVGAVTSYLFGNVMSNHTIAASFSALPQPVVPLTYVLALNAGGTDYVDSGGIRYQADYYFNEGMTGTTNGAIRGTGDDPLYQTGRYGNFFYAIPLENGNYDLTLKFVENTFSSKGKRVFDVLVGGNAVLSNLDIFAAAGKNTALDITFPVNVSDGVLDIRFVPKTGDAQISAILITKPSNSSPKNPPARIRRYFSNQQRTSQ